MTNTLNYICKACGQVQPAEASCTYRNQLGSTVTETAGVTTDVANDPTVGTHSHESDLYGCEMCDERVTCNRCGNNLLVHRKSGKEEEDTQDQFPDDGTLTVPSDGQLHFTRAEADRLIDVLVRASQGKSHPTAEKKVHGGGEKTGIPKIT